MTARSSRISVRGILAGVVLCAGSGGGVGCESTRIAVKEWVGIPKRDQLVARVKDARTSQEQAKAQFESTLQEFVAVTGVKPGQLEGQYDKAKKAFESSESKAKTVSDRIASTDTVAQKLFKEWESELGQYVSPEKRRQSEHQLEETKARYARMIGAMKAAESKMPPVLAAFKDEVLALKHNLNARAVASLSESVKVIESDVARLVAEMNASIAEAGAFIEEIADP